MLSRRSLLLGGLAASVHIGHARSASASLARALSLSELVYQSRHALVGTPATPTCQWETIAGSRRIVTYTRVLVEAPLDGRAPAQRELMVRTLGGTVGHIGQVVPGEARLDPGTPSVIFLVEAASDLFVVTGMAQGHYPLVTDERGVKRLRANREHVVRLDRESAVSRLDGRSVSEAEQLVAAEMVHHAP
jgi:hypothetical protein